MRNNWGACVWKGDFFLGVLPSGNSHRSSFHPAFSEADRVIGTNCIAALRIAVNRLDIHPAECPAKPRSQICWVVGVQEQRACDLLRAWCRQMWRAVQTYASMPWWRQDLTTRQWLLLGLEVFSNTLFARLLKDTVGLFIQFSMLPIAGKPTLLIIGRNGVQQQLFHPHCQWR